ncbi:Uncharacterised protein [uncultured archaeon]|nr:Uncharacterised protein [uncultured archaeon]
MEEEHNSVAGYKIVPSHMIVWEYEPPSFDLAITDYRDTLDTYPPEQAKEIIDAMRGAENAFISLNW